METTDYALGAPVNYRPFNAYMENKYGADAVLTGVVIRRNRRNLTVSGGLGVCTVPLSAIVA